MTLARSWTRQLFGASGAALLVPGSLAGALVILAFAGGFGRLGTLGQAVSGPSLPGVTLGEGGKSALGRELAATAVRTGGAGAPSVAAPTSGAAPSTPAVAPAGAGSGPGGSGSHPGRARTPTGLGGPGATSTPGQPTIPGGGSGNPGTGSAGTGSPPQVPAPPTVVGNVVGLATSLTGQIPRPVGIVTTQALQSLGNTVDRILPLPAAPAAPASQRGVSSP